MKIRSKRINWIAIAVGVIILLQIYNTVINKHLKAENNSLRTKLKAYRVINNRNVARLEKKEESKEIIALCKHYPDMYIYLYSQRVIENGYPGHEYGFKRFFRLHKNEQLDSARILLIQEMIKYTLKHKKGFIRQWSKRINAVDNKKWEKNMLAVIKKVEKEYKEIK